MGQMDQIEIGTVYSWRNLVICVCAIATILFVKNGTGLGMLYSASESSAAAIKLAYRSYGRNTSEYYDSKQIDDFLKILTGGDAIECPANRFVKYDHVGIYIGNGTVIHLMPNSDQGKKDVIIKEPLLNLLKHYKHCRINNLNKEAEVHNLFPKKRAEIIKTATVTMDDFNRGLTKKYNKYSLVDFNCQHFVTQCRFGEPFSPLIDLALGNTAYFPYYLKLFDVYVVQGYN